MKQQFKIATKNGFDLVEGKRFSYYIDNVRYWFFYHKETSWTHNLCISELSSGFKICNVDYSTRVASLNNDKAACKSTLDNLIKKYGAKNVRMRIDSAPKIKAD